MGCLARRAHGHGSAAPAEKWKEALQAAAPVGDRKKQVRSWQTRGVGRWRYRDAAGGGIVRRRQADPVKLEHQHLDLGEGSVRGVLGTSPEVLETGQNVRRPHVTPNLPTNIIPTNTA